MGSNATTSTGADRPPAIAAEEVARRRDALHEALGRAGAAALVLGPGANLAYFTGVRWKLSERFFGCVLTPGKAPMFVCPAFEESRLRGLLPDGFPGDVATWQEDEAPFQLMGRHLCHTGDVPVLLDPALPVSFAYGLQASASPVRFESGQAVIESLRSRKSRNELALIHAAMRITLEVHRSVHQSLVAGVDTASVKSEIDRRHRALNADDGSTFCIVSFGQATAIPHGSPGVQRLERGQWVLIDTGCTLEGYHSDLTRTYVFGEPTARQQELWSLEHRAQIAGFDAAQLGASCSAIDRAARSVLERDGFGPGYRLPGLPHRTGHGIGLELHEAPYFVKGSTQKLEPGMCGSVEPMLAIPGEAGIRLEDHVYLTENGPKWFTEPSPSLEKPFG